LFYCPGDDVDNRGRVLPAKSGGLYRYSYAMNVFLSDFNSYLKTEHTVNAARLKNSSEKVLLVEEDSGTIDDGNWDPTSPYPGLNLLAIRHDRGNKLSDNVATGLP